MNWLGLVAILYVFVTVAALSYFWIWEVSSAEFTRLSDTARRWYTAVWNVGALVWLVVLVWYLVRKVRYER